MSISRGVFLARAELVVVAVVGNVLKRVGHKLFRLSRARHPDKAKPRRPRHKLATVHEHALFGHIFVFQRIGPATCHWNYPLLFEQYLKNTTAKPKQSFFTNPPVLCNLVKSARY